MAESGKTQEPSRHRPGPSGPRDTRAPLRDLRERALPPTQYLTIALALGAGAISGTLGSLVVGSAGAEPSPVVHEVTREIVVRETTPVVGVATTGAPAVRTIPTTGPAAAMTAADAERERVDTERRYREALDAHGREPRDESWAARTEDVVLDRYARASTERGFPGRVIATECRRTTCTVEFEWDGYAEAGSSWQGVIHTHVPGCARRVVLTEPEDPEGPYRATALLTCGDPADDGDTDDERALREGI